VYCTKCTTAYLLTGECKNNSHQLKHDLVVSASEDHTVCINPLTFQDEKPHGFPVVIQEHVLPVVMVRYEHVAIVLLPVSALVCRQFVFEDLRQDS
jgi:hypothetical protein